jgi:hypothetical protein
MEISVTVETAADPEARLFDHRRGFAYEPDVIKTAGKTSTNYVTHKQAV